MGMKDKDPFEAILERYEGMLFALCRGMSRRGTTAEDLVQEAAVALWRSREKLLSLPPGVQQAAWVWRVARNAAIDTLRDTPSTEPLPENLESETERGDSAEALEELRETVDLLEEPDRTIATMHFKGYSYKEIGEETGMTEKNVSVRLVRIKEKLKRMMIG